MIEKKTEDAVTRTQIYPLNEENSVEELARILGRSQDHRYGDAKCQRDEKSGITDEIKNVKIQSIFSEIPYTKTDICNRVSVFLLLCRQKTGWSVGYEKILVS